MKLYRFDYSCYARKVQMVLDLLNLRYDIEEVPFLDRSKLINLTGGYIQVPVLLMDDGTVLKDSRVICKSLLSGDNAERLTPSPWQGPIWAYADWCDSALEDVLFRLASPGIRNRFKTASEKAFFSFIKERKFGEGCVDQWARQSGELVSKARSLLRPTLETLSKQAFIFGDQPTYADATLYGHVKMVEISDPDLLTDIAPDLRLWLNRLTEFSHR
ncbi:glutathione S-transferase [Hahella sp. CCB-MM4]|uniref:glutathione S-transferase family protein n=1 Tax=Hahella sp. (strain CCB-MM4) TaxID=1926491 RepID=UPI000B9AA7A8|nr:glutathione S-transferase family protein [Hahella sp. CCB-MM4]OZG70985.1 glutathione S-transferase [Hahella sp. CCB-MM4]